ncbi:MAG: aldehyde dehydrogenase (NADP(+)) [Opitutales bacterium]|nr:aldehyde dehydrogenase (NADP(+)) [Opitutales bacterium]
MNETDHHLIGHTPSAEGTDFFEARDPVKGEVLDGRYPEATADEIDRAARLAAEAFPGFRATNRADRARFLEAIAEAIEAVAEPLKERCMAETGLPRPRMDMEMGRTLNQIRMFAALVREGSYVEARIDRAQPDRKPLPRPDLRQMLVPLGPVAVFGASNFPFAFSVAGGDTASALAAGNPVIVKAHPSHPGVSAITARAVLSAARACGLPDGVFSLLHGRKPETAIQLITHPAIAAVGFTGSHTAGRALMDAAARRPKPIPVFAEMGSVNPVFLLPGELRANAESITAGIVQSFTMATGQFCTKPGIVFVVDGEESRAWIDRVRAAVAATTPSPMLSEGILKNFRTAVASRRDAKAPALTAEGESAGERTASPVVFRTDLATFQAHPEWHQEIFGPALLVVTVTSLEEMCAVARTLDGQLTASVHSADAELSDAAPLFATLEGIAGRLIRNGFPTGVEVCPAMQHGGPYPASSDTRFTSVGTAAIRRFLRPVCYQGFPAAALPPELRDENPGGLLRLVDNEPSRGKL